jgi:hypothetical protein
MNESENEKKAYVISHMALRQYVGYLAIALPFLVVAFAQLSGQADLETSLSRYYHTASRDIFVGVVCAIAVFFLAYEGPDSKKDGRLADGLCLCAAGVALFPTSAVDEPPWPESLISGIHYAFAAGFFLLLIYFSIFLFTKSNLPPADWPAAKKLRNKVYVGCGLFMLACIVAAGLTSLIKAWTGQAVTFFGYPAMLVLETLAIEAFGLSWIVKGEAILGDAPDTSHMPTQAAA